MTLIELENELKRLQKLYDDANGEIGRLTQLCMETSCDIVYVAKKIKLAEEQAQ